MLGNKDNMTIEERYLSDSKVQFALLLIYLLGVFGYSMAIVLLTYQQYINFHESLQNDFQLLIYNWNQNPISNITIVSNSSDATVINEISNSTLVLYQIDTKQVMLQISYLNDFTFVQNYTTEPYCKTGYRLCGGVESSSKYCIFNTTYQNQYLQYCPFNYLLTQDNFTTYNYLKNTSTNLQNFTKFFYDVNIQVNNYTLMSLSTYQSYQPITNLRFGYNGQVCKDSSQFYECDQKLLNYKPINQTNATTVLKLNNINSDSIPSNATIGLFLERYIQFNITCRYTLVERVLESPNYYNHLKYILYIQTILTFVYVLFIGIVLNLIQFFLLNDFSFLIGTTQDSLLTIKRVIYSIRFICFIPLGTIICLLYFYEAQFNDTINRIYNEKCIEEEFEYIFYNTLQDIKDFRNNQIAVFWVWIGALILELFACLFIIYRGANYKKKNLIQKRKEFNVELNHDYLNQQQFRKSYKPQNYSEDQDSQDIKQRIIKNNI